MTLTRAFVLALLCLSLAACKSDEQKAEDAYQRGVALMEEGDMDRARVEFRNAIRDDRLHIEAQRALGRLNQADGSLRPAFRNFRMVVETLPDDIEALTALSQISFLSNDWETFERYSGRLETLEVDDISARVVQLAARYRQSVLDEDVEARADLLTQAREIRAEATEDAVLQRLLIDGNLADGRYEEAIVEISNSIELQPRNIDLYKLKVQILAQLGDLNSVDTELRKIVELFPADEESQTTLIRFLIGRGQVDDAEAVLRDRLAEAKADDNEPRIMLISFLTAQRSREAALAELEEMLAADATNHELRALRAVMNFEMGNLEAATAELESLVQQEAGTDNYTVEMQQSHKVILAKVLRESGNKVGSRRLVDEILEQDANDVEALKMRAGWLIDEDNVNGAITALRTAMGENPGDAEAMTLMARAYDRAGDDKLTMEFLSLAVEASNNAPEESLRFATALLADERFKQAETVLINALRLQPRDVALLSDLGRVYMRLEDFPRAKQVIETLRNIDRPIAQSAANGLDLELVSREEGTQRALEVLEQLAQTDDGTMTAKLGLIRALLQTGEVEKARTFADELVAEEPENDAYVFFQALAQAANLEFDAAEATANGLLEKNPEALPVWQLLVRLNSATKGPEAGLAVLDRALESLPGNGQLMWAKASFMEQLGNFDAAIGVYEELYAQNSDSIIAANNLASMITTYKNDPESLARADTIARRFRDTDIPAFQDTYGWILHRTGKSEEALPYLESAASGLSNDPMVQLHLGHVYLALGRVEEAEGQLSRARSAMGAVRNPVLEERIDQLEQALRQN